MITIIPETCHADLIRYLPFYYYPSYVA